MKKDIEKVLRQAEQKDVGIGTPDRWVLSPSELQMTIDLVVSKDRQRLMETCRASLAASLAASLKLEREINARLAEKLIEAGCPELIPLTLRGRTKP